MHSSYPFVSSTDDCTRPPNQRLLFKLLSISSGQASDSPLSLLPQQMTLTPNNTRTLTDWNSSTTAMLPSAASGFISSSLLVTPLRRMPPLLVVVPRFLSSTRLPMAVLVNCSSWNTAQSWNWITLMTLTRLTDLSLTPSRKGRRQALNQKIPTQPRRSDLPTSSGASPTGSNPYLVLHWRSSTPNPLLTTIRTPKRIRKKASRSSLSSLP